MLDAEALDVLWDRVKDRLYVKRADWEYALVKLGWDAHAVQVNGAVTGAVLTRGHEVHIAGTGITRAHINDVLIPIIMKHGRVTTRIPHELIPEQAFAERLGFNRTGECKFDYHYELKDNRYARSHR